MATKIDGKEDLVVKAKADASSANSVDALRAVVQTLVDAVQDLETRLKKLEG
jgi:hypothetical protein